MFQKLLLLVFLLHVCSSEEPPSVVTKSGKIVGHYLTSFAGKKYEAYHGIPYALPPIGERRFEPPVPIPSWSGELLGNRLQSSCWQVKRLPDASDSLLHGTEDCLYLNVFVPHTKKNKTLPVLFWIHGGGFQYGSNDVDEEAYLMDYEVILVTSQYRLGVFGFLSTEDKVVPGNMGLKDQSLALKWVHENVEHFGGDPARITLYGLSAGAASVHYHYLSPMSKGLFRNGVSFSGTAYDFEMQDKNSRLKALELGKFMNCTTSSTEAMVKCLRESPTRDLVNAQLIFMRGPQDPFVPFAPVVEKYSENPFVDRSPREILESGRAYDAPWITGVVSEEGLFPVTEWTDDAALKDINDNWDEIAPVLLGYSDTIPPDNHTRLARTIRKHYFGDKPINRETFMNLVYMVGERWYVVNGENAARAQAKANRSPVLFYRYTYRATDSLTFRRTNSSEYFGVCHGDDVYLFMKNDVMSPKKSSSDMAMMKQSIEALVSFASQGISSFDKSWSSLDPTKDLRYLEISGPDRVTMKSTDNLGQRKFWNSIDFNENK